MPSVPVLPNLIASGSTEAIIEYLYYAVNSVLFYRGVYELEDFHAVNKYEQDLLMTDNLELRDFLDKFFKQVEKWLNRDLIHQVVLVIVSKDTGKTLERWVFNLEPHSRPTHPDKIKLQIQSSLKQLKSTIPVFPDLNGPTVFNLLAVAKDERSDLLEDTAETWADAHPHAIPAEIRDQTALRGFNTDNAKLDINVVYVDQQ